MYSISPSKIDNTGPCEKKNVTIYVKKTFFEPSFVRTTLSGEDDKDRFVDKMSVSVPKDVETVLAMWD